MAVDLLPEGAGILRAGNGLSRLWSSVGVAGLGDPDGLALGSTTSVVERLEQEVGSVTDRVVLLCLEVRETVHAEKVAVVDDLGVAAVDPGSLVTDKLAHNLFTLVLEVVLTQVSTWPTGAAEREVPLMRLRTSPI